jgi:hypothetical protein
VRASRSHFFLSSFDRAFFVYWPIVFNCEVDARARYVESIRGDLFNANGRYYCFDKLGTISAHRERKNDAGFACNQRLKTIPALRRIAHLLKAIPCF